MIRPAELRDASALAKLMTELGYATETREMSERLQSIFANPHFATLVAVDGDEVSGMIRSSPMPAMNTMTSLVAFLP